MSKADAEAAKRKLEAAGATVTVRLQSGSTELPETSAQTAIDVIPPDDRVFGRQGTDLTVTVPIYPHQWKKRATSFHDELAPGTKLIVPTMNGPAEVSPPAGTRDGAVLRLPGLGAPQPYGGHGDLLVTIKSASYYPARLIGEAVTIGVKWPYRWVWRHSAP